MATEKDTAMGDLEALNDVFSDIMNVLMFKGKRLVSEFDLEQGREKSSYDSDQQIRLRPQYRDIYKFWKNITFLMLEKMLKICLLLISL